MQRNRMVDICKGIGIISIVMGHSSWYVTIGNTNLQVGPFVYLYHLAIFFFCSGYLYKDEDMGTFLKKKVRGLYLPFVTYSFLYLALRPIFLNLKLVDGQPYTIQETIIRCSDALLFNGGIEFLSAFWFFPMMFVTMSAYAFVSWVSKIIAQRFSDSIRLVLCTIIAIIGLYLTAANCGMIYNMQIAYLMVFVVEVGRWFKKFEHIIHRFIGIITLAISVIIMVVVLKSNIGIIELSKCMIISKKLFYPVTMVGILFCISLSSLIEKNKYFSNIISYIGKNSLDIMVLHFFAIKICDLIYSMILNDFTNLSMFPYSYPNLWTLYYVGGVGIPLLLMYLFRKTKVKLLRIWSEK